MIYDTWSESLSDVRTLLTTLNAILSYQYKLLTRIVE